MIRVSVSVRELRVRLFYYCRQTRCLKTLRVLGVLIVVGVVDVVARVPVLGGGVSKGRSLGGGRGPEGRRRGVLINV